MASHESALIYAALTVVALSRNIVSAVLPPLGRELGLGETQVGAIFTLGALALMVCGPFFGRLSDRRGRMAVAVAGLVVLGLSNLTFVALASVGLSAGGAGVEIFAGLLVTRLFFGLGSGAVQPATQAWLIDRADSGKRLGAIAGAASALTLGGLVGPAVGGLLGGLYLLAPFWVSAAAALTLAFLLVVFVRAPAPRAPAGDGPPLRFGDPRYRFHLILRALLFTLLAGVTQTAGFVFQDRLGLSAESTARQVGLALTLMALTTLALQGAIARFVRAAPERLLLVSLPLAAFGAALFGLAQDGVALTFGLCVYGSALALWAPASAALPAMAVGDDEQGALSGLVITSAAIGYVLGPLAATALYDVWPAALTLVNVSAHLLVFAVLARRAMTHS